MIYDLSTSLLHHAASLYLEQRRAKPLIYHVFLGRYYKTRDFMFTQILNLRLKTFFEYVDYSDHRGLFHSRRPLSPSSRRVCEQRRKALVTSHLRRITIAKRHTTIVINLYLNLSKSFQIHKPDQTHLHDTPRKLHIANSHNCPKTRRSASSWYL